MSICRFTQPVLQCIHEKRGDIVNETDLINRLCEDLSMIGLPVNEVEISIRPFSESYWGRYFPLYEDSKYDIPKVYVYPYKKDNVMYSYPTCLETAIHEMVHHLQYSDPKWKRFKNVAHDTDFWRKYNHYMFLAKISGVIPYDYVSKTA